jgi:hypothetical protein
LAGKVQDKTRRVEKRHESPVIIHAKHTATL